MIRRERVPVPDTAAPEPKLLTTVRRDVRDVVVGVRRAGFKATVRRTFSELESVYLSAHRKNRLASMRSGGRWLFLWAWLLTSLYLQLTPSRRVLFLVGVLLVLQGSQVISSERVHVVVDFSF